MAIARCGVQSQSKDQSWGSRGKAAGLTSCSVWMVVAIAILNQVDVKEFKDNTSQALATVMEGDLD